MQEYNNVDRRLHLLCQIQALVTANLVEEEDDYSHTNLAFDPIGKRLLSRWMYVGKHYFCLAINLDTFYFEWLNPGLKTIHEILIEGKTYSQLKTEVNERLRVIGPGSAELSLHLPYEIEKYPFIDQPFQKFSENELHIWMNHRITAIHSCAALMKYLNMNREIRIWPHHFDTGIYVEIADILGIGFGLAMQDDMVESPYFYMIGYGLHQEISMNNLPELTSGSWKTAEWKGAILPLAVIDQIMDTEVNETIYAFIRTALDFYLSTSVKNALL